MTRRPSKFTQFIFDLCYAIVQMVVKFPSTKSKIIVSFLYHPICIAQLSRPLSG